DFLINKFRQLGYYTTSISPFAERHSAYWFCAGWNEMYNTGKAGLESADDLFPYAAEWLKKHKNENNWFLHINLWDPHTPYRTPESFETPFNDNFIPEWMNEETIQKHRKSYGPHSARELHGFKEHKIITKVFPRIKSGEIKNLDDFKNWIAAYDTGILYADNFIGRIIKILEEAEIYDDTLIFISSDHGESQGELNVYGDHATADHIVNRVPFIIKWPKHDWNAEYSELLYTNDIAATIIEKLGGRVPKSWDGRSFLAKVNSNEKIGRKFLVLSQNAWSCQRSVRFDNWILIKTYHTGMKDYPEYMLYDLEKDFHMQHNLVDAKPDILNEGMKLLDLWYKKMMSSSNFQNDPMWTVIQEGGPFHTRGMLKKYIRRLKKTGREKMIKKIKEREEVYK
ncbi:MAG: sulfatase-like hydrolase/transferase, partial [Candidatus Lokiarchaeota archaeon]|nr:sulfatase-like hydrolase/transferase [Candidatus Lokiarchaeota archaeon]MBD3198574.1 sulfatase-like hydrolase/transferase [Candidatus Lokiarchaeota archaeon]